MPKSPRPAEQWVWGEEITHYTNSSWSWSLQRLFDFTDRRRAIWCSSCCLHAHHSTSYYDTIWCTFLCSFLYSLAANWHTKFQFLEALWKRHDACQSSTLFSNRPWGCHAREFLQGDAKAATLLDVEQGLVWKWGRASFRLSAWWKAMPSQRLLSTSDVLVQSANECIFALSWELPTSWSKLSLGPYKGDLLMVINF